MGGEVFGHISVVCQTRQQAGIVDVVERLNKIFGRDSLEAHEHGELEHILARKDLIRIAHNLYFVVLVGYVFVRVFELLKFFDGFEQFGKCLGVFEAAL